MSKSNRDLCIEIINNIPEDQLSHVAVFLKSVKILSDELFSETKIDKLTEIYKGISSDSSFEASDEGNFGSIDSLAEKIGIKLK